MFRFQMMNPFDSMQREMEHLFRGLDLGPIVRREQNQIDFSVREQEDGYVVAAAVPGIDVEKLEINVIGRRLTIKGEFAAPQLPENARIHRQERRSGHFERILHLPTSLDTDKIVADYKDGILTIALPKAEAALPRKIMVKAG